MRVKVIYVEITNQCNLNCRTCYNRSGLNKERKEVSKAQLITMIEKFLPYGLHRVILSGGEPTLHTSFHDVLGLVDQYPNLSFGVVTNGTNPDGKLIEMLNTRKNLTLQVSLDGSREEQNEKTRGKGNFEKAISFAKQIHNPNSTPLLKMVVSQQNYDDIESFYKLAISLGFLPEFAFIYKSGNGSEQWENKSLSPQQKMKALNLIERLNKEFDTEAFLPLCSMKCPYVDGTDGLSLCVKTDGSIQPCQTLYDGRYSLGNIFHLDMDSIEKKAQEMAQLAQQRMRCDYGCDRCLLQEECSKGCMAAAVNLHGDPLQNDGDCEYRKLIFVKQSLSKIKKDLIE